MVDAVDSKSAVRKDVWVRYPPRVLNGGRSTAVLFLYYRRACALVPVRVSNQPCPLPMALA